MTDKPMLTPIEVWNQAQRIIYLLRNGLIDRVTERAMMAELRERTPLVNDAENES